MTIQHYRNLVIDGQAYSWSFSVFNPKQVFGSLYCQISTNLDKKILYTPIVVRNTLVGRLRLWSAHEWLQAKPEWLCFFVILVMYPKSYTYIDGSPWFRRQTVKVEARTLLLWKIPEFCSVGVTRSKTAFFCIFRVPFDCPAHSLQETVLLQTNGTNGKPRLWRDAFC